MVKVRVYDLNALRTVSTRACQDETYVQGVLDDICQEFSAEVIPTLREDVFLLKGIRLYAVVVDADTDYIRALVEASGALVLSQEELDLVFSELRKMANDLSRSPLHANIQISDSALKYSIFAFLMAAENWRDYTGIISRILTPEPISSVHA